MFVATDNCEDCHNYTTAGVICVHSLQEASIIGH